MFPRPLLLIASLFLAVAVVGCAQTRAPLESSPEGTRSGLATTVAPGWDPVMGGARTNGEQPLAVGNRWRYSGWAEYSAEGGASPEFVRGSGPEVEHEIVRREARDGRMYAVTRLTYSAASEISYAWLLSREDREGLYEWDGLSESAPGGPTTAGGDTRATSVSDARPWPAVAARLGVDAGSALWRSAWERLESRRSSLAGILRALPRATGEAVGSGEIQRLRYPLHPGQSWTIRPEPLFESRVEDARVLRTPAGSFPAWTIRIRSELFDPDDVVLTWYGPAGYLGLDARLRSVVTDTNGNPLDTLVWSQGETLEEIHLVGQRRSRGPSPRGPVAAPWR